MKKGKVDPYYPGEIHRKRRSNIHLAVCFAFNKRSRRITTYKMQN